MKKLVIIILIAVIAGLILLDLLSLVTGSFQYTQMFMKRRWFVWLRENWFILMAVSFVCGIVTDRLSKSNKS